MGTNYAGSDSFGTTIFLPDDTDLITPAAATLNPGPEALADRTVWLKNRTKNSLVNVYGNALGTPGFGNVWSDTNPLSSADPAFAELTGAGDLIAFGSPFALQFADTLVVRCDVSVNIAAITGVTTALGIALGLSLNGGAFVVIPQSARYMVPLQDGGVLLPNTSPMSLSAIVQAGVASSFNFCLMGAVVGTSMRVELRGSGAISALHLRAN